MASHGREQVIGVLEHQGEGGGAFGGGEVRLGTSHQRLERGHSRGDGRDDFAGSRGGSLGGGDTDFFKGGGRRLAHGADDGFHFGRRGADGSLGNGGRHLGLELDRSGGGGGGGLGRRFRHGANHERSRGRAHGDGGGHSVSGGGHPRAGFFGGDEAGGFARDLRDTHGAKLRLIGGHARLIGAGGDRKQGGERNDGQQGI